MTDAMKFDLPYLSREHDRHGKLRLFFRKRGQPKKALHFEIGTPEFFEEYNAALGKPRAKASSPEGTFEGLANLYFASQEFKSLARQSQSNRRAIIRACMAEPTKPGSTDIMAECPIARLTPAAVRMLRDRKADMPGAANNRLKYLSSLFSWAVEAGHMATNPARDVKRVKYATDGFHTWTEAEVRQFEERHPQGTKARLALDLLLYTGARRNDAVTFGWQHIRDGWFSFIPRKTAYKRLEPVEFPVGDLLAAALEFAPRGQLTFLLTEFGKPFTAAGFGNWFRSRCDEAGLPHCSAHGLRKAGAARFAELGATDRQLMARYGWSSASQATVYTKRAEKRRLTAAVEELVSERSDTMPKSSSRRKQKQ